MTPAHHSHGHDHGSSHEHEHKPAHGVWGRLRHAVSDVFGGHSHDTADQVDEALEADARGRRALWLSLAALAITAILQGVVVVFTGSIALLGDTLHNVADAATAIPLLIAFWLAKRPANDRYTYGYGRAEDLAGLFVVAMITLSSVVAGWEAINRLLNPRDVSHRGAVAAAGVIGFVGNELVARYRINVGHQIGSAALVADGLHARTDGFTSLAVVVGAAGVAAGLPWADPVIGLLIAIAILDVLRSAVTQVGARHLRRNRARHRPPRRRTADHPDSPAHRRPDSRQPAAGARSGRLTAPSLHEVIDPLGDMSEEMDMPTNSNLPRRGLLTLAAAAGAAVLAACSGGSGDQAATASSGGMGGMSMSSSSSMPAASSSNSPAMPIHHGKTGPVPLG